MWFLFPLACSPSAPPAPNPQAPPSEPAAEPAPETATRSATVTDNAPPQITSVTLEPEAPTQADEIYLTVKVEDPELDPLTPTYRWFVNGEEAGEVTGLRFPAGRLKHGDTVHVEIEVADDGPPARARTRTVTIVNRPPVIDPNCARPSYIDGFSMKAEDPDGDPIIWRTEGQPPGFSIEKTGILRYEARRDTPAGSYLIGIIAEDGNGGWSRLDLKIDVAAGSDAARAVAP